MGESWEAGGVGPRVRGHGVCGPQLQLSGPGLRGPRRLGGVEGEPSRDSGGWEGGAVALAGRPQVAV